MSLNLLLVQPNTAYTPMSKLGQFYFEPLALEYIAGALNKENSVKILDLRVTEVLFEDCITQFKPDIVGFSCSSFQVNEVLHLAEVVKSISPKIVTVVGGYHVNLRAQDLHSPNMDYCCLGNGQSTMKEVVLQVEQNIPRESKTQNIIGNLTLNYELTFPLRSYMELHKLPCAT